MTTITIDRALLEQALSAHILSLPYIGAGYKTAHTHDTVQASISALRAAIEQDRAQRGEPVAWLYESEYSSGSYSPNYFEWRVTLNKAEAQTARRLKPLYTAPQPERKPMMDQTAHDMNLVAEKYAHKLALDLECVLADYSGTWYETAMKTLGDYRSAMNAIHERESPTFMGEPLLPAIAKAEGRKE